MTPGALAAPLVSVVVPVRDNPDGIRALLTCLDAQTLARDRFEVIIGDDGSRVGSITQFATADDRIHVVTQPPRTSYAARNQAAAAARGDVLAFTDSDCLPHARWLEEGLTALEEADIVAGHVSFVAPARPTLWSVLTVDMYLDQQRNVQRSRAATANLFVWREGFERWGGVRSLAGIRWGLRFRAPCGRAGRPARIRRRSGRSPPDGRPRATVSPEVVEDEPLGRGSWGPSRPPGCSEARADLRPGVGCRADPPGGASSNRATGVRPSLRRRFDTERMGRGMRPRAPLHAGGSRGQPRQVFRLARGSPRRSASRPRI